MTRLRLAGRSTDGELGDPGARTVEQLTDNLGAAGLHLSKEETATLDAASNPAPADSPYGAPGTEQRSRELAGTAGG